MVLKVVVSCGLVTLALAGVGAGSDGVPCGPRHARTVATSGTTRVYVAVTENTGPRYPACRRGEGRPLELDDPDEGIHVFPAPALKASGPYVASAVEFFVNDPDRDGTAVLVDDLRRKSADKPVATADAGTGQYAQVGSLVLTRAGAVAWISCPSRDFTDASRSPGCVRAGRRDTVHRLAAGSRKARPVAGGKNIDPSSLTLRGQTASWRQGGRLRSVRIP